MTGNSKEELTNANDPSPGGYLDWLKRYIYPGGIDEKSETGVNKMDVDDSTSSTNNEYKPKSSNESISSAFKTCASDKGKTGRDGESKKNYLSKKSALDQGKISQEKSQSKAKGKTARMKADKGQNIPSGAKTQNGKGKSKTGKVSFKKKHEYSEVPTKDASATSDETKPTPIQTLDNAPETDLQVSDSPQLRELD